VNFLTGWATTINFLRWTLFLEVTNISKDDDNHTAAAAAAAADDDDITLDKIM
jgi:hypothetical protein